MVVDAQLESLRRIRDAKESAKSVKTDDAEVPVYMWNKQVREGVFGSGSNFPGG